MASLRSPSAPVKPERPPYRPLLSAPQASYWTDEVGAFHILLSSRRKTAAYDLLPLSTDFGGAAFRWFQPEGECYDVLVHGTDSSCSCKGWAYTVAPPPALEHKDAEADAPKGRGRKDKAA